MADFMKMLQQAQELQGRLQKVEQELGQQTFKASSGGGMVTVEAYGHGVVRSATRNAARDRRASDDDET